MSIIVFHGTKGSPEGNWFPWLQAQLPDVIVPRMPTPDGQNLNNWLKHAPAIDIDDILIGHSCGATFVLHLLERYKVRQAVFVAPVMGSINIPEYDSLNKSFYDHIFDWTKIRKNAGAMNIFHGDNDPYVPLPHAFELQNGLGCALEIVKNGGHLNVEAGYTQFPGLLSLLKS